MPGSIRGACLAHVWVRPDLRTLHDWRSCAPRVVYRTRPLRVCFTSSRHFASAIEAPRDTAPAHAYRVVEPGRTRGCVGCTQGWPVAVVIGKRRMVRTACTKRQPASHPPTRWSLRR